MVGSRGGVSELSNQDNFYTVLDRPQDVFLFHKNLGVVDGAAALLTVQRVQRVIWCSRAGTTLRCLGLPRLVVVRFICWFLSGGPAISTVSS